MIPAKHQRRAPLDSPAPWVRSRAATITALSVLLSLADQIEAPKRLELLLAVMKPYNTSLMKSHETPPSMLLPH